MPDCRILVVDDDVSTLQVICDVLQDDGYLPLGATSGDHALRLAGQISPDLVLLDWRMPGLSGPEVARLLRARGVTAPIIAITAAVFPRDWVPDPRVTGYFAKPFELAELLALVDRYCPLRDAPAIA